MPLKRNRAASEVKEIHCSSYIMFLMDFHVFVRCVVGVANEKMHFAEASCGTWRTHFVENHENLCTTLLKCETYLVSNLLAYFWFTITSKAFSLTHLLAALLSSSFYEIFRIQFQFATNKMRSNFSFEMFVQLKTINILTYDTQKKNRIFDIYGFAVESFMIHFRVSGQSKILLVFPSNSFLFWYLIKNKFWSMFPFSNVAVAAVWVHCWMCNIPKIVSAFYFKYHHYQVNSVLS